MSKITVLQAPRARITMEDYMDLLKAVGQCVQQLRPMRRNQHDLNLAEGLLKQVEWAARFNHKFREESFPYLEAILDELYEEING